MVKAVTRQVLFLVVAGVLAATGVASTQSMATASPAATPVSVDLVTGRKLYRQFCGKCHALDAALSAGFGSSNKLGFGEYGGPSFNALRVPYVFSVSAVTTPTGGHEKVRTRINATQLHKVAAFIARVTRHNPVPAKPTDG
jgi:mono/diheme cytochrome c family protein